MAETVEKGDLIKTEEYGDVVVYSIGNNSYTVSDGKGYRFVIPKISVISIVEKGKADSEIRVYKLDDAPKSKVCQICKRDLPINEYSRQKGNTLRNNCKECQSELQREGREKAKERMKAAKAETINKLKQADQLEKEKSYREWEERREVEKVVNKLVQAKPVKEVKENNNSDLTVEDVIRNFLTPAEFAGWQKGNEIREVLERVVANE